MQKIIYRDPVVTIFQSALYQTNSTVIRTDDAVLVVDPGVLPSEVRAIKDFVDDIKEDRLLFLIFTHSDYDHILGHGAFEADKIFTSKAMAENPDKARAVERALAFDEEFYIQRPYPLSYPMGDFVVFRDGVQYRHGQTKLTFYLTPGHTADSMMIVVWQIGLLIAGDYLSDLEFPFIEHSSQAYVETMEKLLRIHDRNWFTRMVPGHGNPALTINDWLHRRTESLAYIFALRESIATDIPFDEETLWNRYRFGRMQRPYHEANVQLLTREYEAGLWQWDPENLPLIDPDIRRKPSEEEESGFGNEE